MAFAKFETREYAEAALTASNEMNLGAEWAKRNLDVEGAPEERPKPSPKEVPEGDWVCSKCNDIQFAKRTVCRMCNTPRYGGGWGGGAYSGRGESYREHAEREGGPIDTICILDMHSKGLSEDYARKEFGELPGFVMMKVNPKMGVAFAKFTTRYHAEAALKAANTMGLGAEWAKRNLSVESPDGRDEREPPAKRSRTGDYSYGGSQSARWDGGNYHEQYPLSRKPPPSGPDARIDTITILGMHEKDLTESYLRQEFADIPGFVMMKCNPRKGIAFVKFSTPHHAEAALEAANSMGLGAEWANRNCEVEGSQDEFVRGADWRPPDRHTGSLAAALAERRGYRDSVANGKGGGKGADVPVGDWVCPSCGDVQFARRMTCRRCNCPKPLGGGGGFGKGGGGGYRDERPSAEFKAKAAEEGGPVDTVAILNMHEKKLTEEYLRAEFADLPGFVFMKVNPKMGCAFAKFESREDAESAMDTANAMGMSAEWAKRNLVKE
eukprot:gnl/MRDRNA2_/MRDRNA2_59470_c0_seq1.p1 gnl/MRDRNA2_/MRDRNA2_59470_c0~~gnl/MRDRNA2_/MRDRNA2_59470_c0_seq1.p1  ORF type:complete len:569 (+),score=116.93 gnl/MRDRNA2_/MRDRNA2_59470_c0_seq1:223-1707(+)